jgi:CCR4-NOT transcription complex subunit 1
LLLRLLLDVSEVMPEAMVLSLADVLQALQPRLLPGFSFAWLELVSHRCFMPRMLQAKKNKGWAPFQRLLLGLFKYMEPYLRVAELHEPIKLLYKGALRVLLVLLHDFPEFLCENHCALCDVIPSSCIQLRNLILSAFPRNMLLPDPFTPQLKVDLLPEITKAPAILSNFTGALNASSLREPLDAFLKGRGSRSFLADLPSQLLLPTLAEAASSGTRYNVPLINSLVLYTAVHAIMQNAGQDKNPVTTGASMEVFVKLSRDLDTEGRYLLLNAIANQLRFPNSHTHYLSCVLLFLFQSTHDKELVREQITRVLIERLIVNKPHPWGVLITFIELIKNPVCPPSLFLSSSPLRWCGALPLTPLPKPETARGRAWR